MPNETAATDDIAERILVAVSVISFWAMLVVVPALLALTWDALGQGHYGSVRDPKLLVAVVLVPLSPCFAALVLGLWNIRTFGRLRREFCGLDVLSIFALTCIITLCSAVAVELSGGP
jgi:hypothetical protein